MGLFDSAMYQCGRGRREQNLTRAGFVAPTATSETPKRRSVGLAPPLNLIAFTSATSTQQRIPKG